MPSPKWPPHITERLIALVKAGHTKREIARMMVLGVGEIAAKISSLGMTAPLCRPQEKSAAAGRAFAERHAHMWFEDVPEDVVQKEWPVGKVFNWRPLVRAAQYSQIGNAGALCVGAL